MDTVHSIYELLKTQAETNGERTAVLYDTFAVTYEKLFQDAVKKALHLQRFAGNRIALYGPASYRWIVNLFGTILAGKDVVLVDFFLPQAERAALLKKVHADYVLSSTNQYILADAHANIIAGAEKDDVDGLVYDTATKEGNVVMFTATAKESDKAVVLATGNLFYTVNAMNNNSYCEPDDRILAQTSLHHVFGLVYSLLWPLANGACVCVGRGLRHYDADTHYYHATILPGAPSMIEYLKRTKAFNSSLKTVIIGGAPCSYRLYESLKNRDYNVYTIYGMTECSGGVGIGRDSDGSFELYDPSAVTLGEDGEILVSGACVMQGYDKDTVANEAIKAEGVFHTGDYGRFNTHGRLVVTKRNPGILLLPTGEKICKRVINDELGRLNDVAESYISLEEEQVTAVLVPIKKDMTVDRMKRKLEKYNEKKGYCFEIQKLILLDRPLPKLADGNVDEEATERLIAQELQKNEHLADIV